MDFIHHTYCPPDKLSQTFLLVLMEYFLYKALFQGFHIPFPCLRIANLRTKRMLTLCILQNTSDCTLNAQWTFTNLRWLDCPDFPFHMAALWTKHTLEVQLSKQWFLKGGTFHIIFTTSCISWNFFILIQDVSLPYYFLIKI